MSWSQMCPPLERGLLKNVIDVKSGIAIAWIANAGLSECLSGRNAQCVD